MVCAIVCAASRAHAGDTPETPEALAYFDDGTAAFERNDYAAASRAFAAGYELENWNGFLFAWAQSERKAGNCDKAVSLYSRFIATKPGDTATEHALGWIKACGGTYVEPPPEPPPSTPEPPSKPVAPASPPVEPPRPQPVRPGFPHKLAIGLGAGALAAGGVAVWGLVRSGNDFDRAEDAVDYKDVVRFRDRGEERLLIARISLGVGLGLATATVLRIVLQERSPRRTEVVPTGSGLAVRGSF